MMARIDFKPVAFLFVLLWLFAPFTPGQTTKPKTQTAKPKTSKIKAAEAKAAAIARRTRALQLMEEVLANAKLLDETGTRASVQARAGDALWVADQDRARAAFHAAWDSATAADREVTESTPATGDPLLGRVGTYAVNRQDVLSVVARRDQALADEFITKLVDPTEDAAEGSKGSNNTTYSDPWPKLSPHATYLVSLAVEQLEAGEPGRAVQFALPAVNEGISVELIKFVLRLWSVDRAAAEQLYVRLVERALNDRSTRANEILLLSTPVISPTYVIAVDEHGGMFGVTFGREIKPFQISAGARQAFFRTAADVLMRPFVPKGDSGLTQESFARYYAGERLLPFFVAEAPQFAAQIQMRNVSLANEIDSAWRDRMAPEIARMGYPVDRLGDPLREQSAQLERVRDPAVRDQILWQMVLTAAHRRYWDRAKVKADEISDPGIRRAAFSFIQLSQIADLTRLAGEEQETDFLSLASFVRKADVPPLATAWGFAQTALIAKRLNKVLAANSLFVEASTYAGKTASGSEERVAAFVMLANLMLEHDQRQAWLVVPDVVHATDALDDYLRDDEFSGALPQLAVSLDLDGDYGLTAEVFRMDRLFAALARLDFDRAADLARGFGSRMAKIDTMLSVAKVELSRK